MDLLQTARELADKRYVKGKHQMFSVLQTKSGKVFSGAHVEAGNGRITLCAEAVAIEAAASGAKAVGMMNHEFVMEAPRPKLQEAATL